jgi:hypothetical protein
MNLYEIVELEGFLILEGRYSSKAVAKKYGIPIKDAVLVRELSKALRSITNALTSVSHEYEDFMLKWAVLDEVLADRMMGQLKNRAWRTLYSRYGDKLGLSYEELVAWGKWVVSNRADVDPDGLSTEESESLGEAEAALEEAELENGYYISNKKVWYDEDADVYITYVPGVPHAVQLPGAVHRDLVRAYSNFDGNPASINEIARTFKLPRNWVVKYLRAHEITHDREPFTPEEVLSRTEDDLAEEALQIKRSSLYRRLESDKWKEVQKDAGKWRDFETTVLADLRGVSRTPNKVTRINMEKAEESYCGVVGLSDFHHGKYSDALENGEAYNRDIARERLFAATEEVISSIAAFGAPDKLYVPVGSDFLHIDNDNNTTTKGTPQDSDGTPAEILVTGCQLMESWVDLLRQVAPVELVLMSGNHDRLTGLAILLYLDALYRDSEDVVVNRCRLPRVYRKYGSNLLGFVHGDGVSKTKDLAGHMAREAPEYWSSCTAKTVYTGHLHYERTETDVQFGVTRRQLPSLSGPDRWHARAGYVGAPKALPIYLHRQRGGVFAVVYGR